MNFMNFANKSAFVIVGSVLALSACGKKNNDKKDDSSKKISQPYQKNAQILADAQGGIDGAKVSCSGVQKFTLTTGESTNDTFSLVGTYSANTVNFASITEKDKTGKDTSIDLNQFGIEFHCTAYKVAKLMPQLKDWTYALTSCTDDSGKTYKITSSTPISGAQLWCAQ